ncbi:dnaJ homolog subfamily C member 7-like [Culicoides brevitarsis]|uniref:dnaJ homolog subfamily C member 7-like n=1 Tax=Culicoides brevitarsis TaxID=469753 RepID=UPI00307C949B
METDEIIDVSDSDIEFVQEYTDLEPEIPSSSIRVKQENAKPSLSKAQSTSSVVDMEVDAEDVLKAATIAEERKNEGNTLYKVREYVDALRCYSDAVQLCPNNAPYLGNRSACYMMLGRYNEALKDARQSVQIDPNFEKGYVRVAKCCLALGDLVGAEQAIKKLLEIATNGENLVKTEVDQLKQLRGLEEKARECYDKQDYRTCLYQMEQALKLSPVCRKYQLMKGECLALLGRLDEANDIAITIMQVESSNADAIFVRGLTLYYGDNLDKGILHFERALALDPDHKHAKIWRTKAKSLREKKEKGNELFKNYKFRDALAMYNEALQIDPLNKDTNSKLYYNRALVNTKLGNLNDAVVDCNEALKINSSYLKALLKRAKCYYDLEKFEECVADYEAALKMDKTYEIKNLLRDAKLALKKSKRKDYYKILGISKNASDDEIKKAYRKRALIHHPDRHSNASDAEKKEQEIKFKEIGEAYAILSDPNKKARFDSGQDLDDNMSGGDFDPSNIYRQFFFDGSGPGSSFGGGSPFGGFGGGGFSFNFG